MDLVFADEVADRGVGDKDFHDHDPALARPYVGATIGKRMPSSTMENWARTLRLLVCRKDIDDTRAPWKQRVELVCKVANVKCPVSAMRSADSIVSRSRISPISTTSGSSRKAARSESAKE